MAATEESGVPKRRGRGRPATTPEERAKQLQNLAYDLAEKQLVAGTASSQVISMLLRDGTSRADLENEKLRNENRLLNARVDGMEAAARMEANIEKALEAFMTYTGEKPGEHDDD